MPIAFLPGHRTTPDTCPACGKVENIKRVCGHCGAEYREPEFKRNRAEFKRNRAGGVLGLMALAVVAYGFYLGWSNDTEYRWLSAAGGVLTAIAAMTAVGVLLFVLASIGIALFGPPDKSGT